MSYTIGEVAERSGFSASALRYYEDIGLVAPATRTGAGYRVYDDHVLARLAFIAQAKRLGCTLEEIAELVDLWDGQRCGPVQRRFHDLVTDKIGDAQRQIVELGALTARRDAAAAQLAGPVSDGACGAGCACFTTEAATNGPAPAALTAETEAQPIVCTLDAAAMPERMTRWRAVLDRARSRARTADGSLRVEFDDEVPLRELAEARRRRAAVLRLLLLRPHRRPSRPSLGGAGARRRRGDRGVAVRAAGMSGSGASRCHR